MVVEVAELRMRYGPKEVLNGVSFQADRGEVVALLGPNGAGKSTTIEILEGFRMRSGGEARVLGVDPAQGDEDWRSRLGIVLQSWRDHGNWRVDELLRHLARYYLPFRPGWKIDELLAAVGLTAQAGQRIRTLSGGQRRRLDVAIGIVGRPEVLFLDEPTAGFDPEARAEFHELVRRLAVEQDTTVLLTTHDLDEAERLADRIVVLAAGRIIASGNQGELTRMIAGDDAVGWTVGGRRFSQSTPDGTGFARDLFARYGEDLRDLEVRRASLADTYLALVRAEEHR